MYVRCAWQSRAGPQKREEVFFTNSKNLTILLVTCDTETVSLT